MNKKFKLVKKPGVKFKKVTMTTKQAHQKQIMQNGYVRDVFYVNIGPNTYFTFTFNALSFTALSGGWWTDQVLQPSYAVKNYSQDRNRWIIQLWNPTTRTIRAAFTFISGR